MDKAAIEALVARFRERINFCYAPILRTITGNPALRVEVGSVPMTDGKTVFLTPPWEMADETKFDHDKSLCGQRDGFIQKCLRCRNEELVDASVFHEAQHILSDSFGAKAQPTTSEQNLFVVEAHDRFGLKPGPWEVNTVEKVNSFFGSRIPVFSTFWNVVEDIYVDGQLVGERQGVAILRQAIYQLALVNGMTRKDGTVSTWSTAPKPARALMAYYCIGMKVQQYAPCLGDDVKDLVDDPELQTLAQRAFAAETPAQRMLVTFDLYDHFKELGLLSKEQEEEPEEPIGFDFDPPPGEGGQGESEEQTDESEPEEGDDESEGSSDGDDEEDGDDESESEGGGDAETDDDDEDDPNAGGGAGDEDFESEEQDEGEEGEQSEPSESGDEAGEESGDQSFPGGSEGDDEIAEEDEEGEPSESSDGDDGDDEGEGEQSQSAEGDDDFDLSDEDEEEEEEPEEHVDEITDAEVEEIDEVMERFSGHSKPEDSDDPYKYNPTIEEQHLMKMVAGRLPWMELDIPSYRVESVNNDPLYARGTSPMNVGLVAPVVNKMKAIMSANDNSRVEKSLTKGPRLDSKHLARIPNEDFRIFAKRSLPQKRDWFVLVSIDTSGSTQNMIGEIRMLANNVGWLLHSVGVRFSMYTNDCDYIRNHEGDVVISLRANTVKGPKEPWQQVAPRVNDLDAGNNNLDGQNLAWCRHMVSQERAARKMIIYVTDGAMPDANAEAELPCLKHHLAALRRERVDLIGVGLRTDSPSRHGLDTIELSNANDLAKLVQGLGERLI